MIYLAQAAVALRIIEGPSWKDFQFVNRKFKGPLKIEAIDINGRRVTSGPDSNLVSVLSLINNGFLFFCFLVVVVLLFVTV